MFESLEIFRMAQAMAIHASARQSVVAQNVANADTPGYVARDIKPFSEVYSPRETEFAINATRPSHLNGHSGGMEIDVFKPAAADADPNGNSVSIENEILKAVEVQREHSRALAIYKSSLDILRTALGR